MKKNQSDNSETSPALEELAAVKRLLVLALLKSGTTQKEIATALGVGQATVSRMFPKGIGAISRAKPKSNN
jgi:predicted transcriptional regulator